MRQGFHETSPSQYDLPPEIHDEIIDNLHAGLPVSNRTTYQSRMRTLMACALTCRSWYPRSQRYLYKTTLHDLPQLRTFVRTLTLVLDADPTGILYLSPCIQISSQHSPYTHLPPQ
ncbi:hypothetical protein K474DRAFT_1660938 [Panus rudis PR-1116 ss-1]|nr:hypothetical protein K474DRAFT_1660938 [Panus rudis PR-1116 ss-1]